LADREALACFEQALVALPHLAESHCMIEQAIDVRFGLRDALTPLGELGRVFDSLRKATTLAEALDHPSRLINALRGVGLVYVRKGDLHQAIPVLERGMGLCQSACARS
jgi:hypothetical protein